MTHPVSLAPTPAPPPSTRAARAAAAGPSGAFEEALTHTATSSEPGDAGSVASGRVRLDSDGSGDDSEWTSPAVVALPAVFVPVAEAPDPVAAGNTAPAIEVATACTDVSQCGPSRTPETISFEPVNSDVASESHCQLESDPPRTTDTSTDPAARSETPAPPLRSHESPDAAAQPHTDAPTRRFSRTENGTTSPPAVSPDPVDGDRQGPRRPSGAPPIEHRPDTNTRGVALGASASQAKAVARAVVADALQRHELTEAPRYGSDAKPSAAVATVPLPSVVPSANIGAVPGDGVAARVRDLAAAMAVVRDTGDIDAAVQERGEGREAGTGDRRGHNHESLPSSGSGRLGARGLDAPASMMFPAHAAFTAALDRSASALPPIASTHSGAEQLASVVPQIVRTMHVQVTAGGGEVKLTLTPENLGTVTIELRVDQHRVAASLAADTAAVRGWIAAHEQDLKAGLAELGLQLEEFVVRDDDPREKRQHQPDPSPGARRRRAKAGDPAFEVHA